MNTKREWLVARERLSSFIETFRTLVGGSLLTGSKARYSRGLLYPCLTATPPGYVASRIYSISFQAFKVTFRLPFEGGTQYAS